MLDVAAARPGVDEGRALAEEMGFAVVAESGEGTAEVQMEFGTDGTELTAKDRMRWWRRRSETENNSAGSGEGTKFPVRHLQCSKGQERAV
jgi:hypothetical protein